MTGNFIVQLTASVHTANGLSTSDPAPIGHRHVTHYRWTVTGATFSSVDDVTLTQNFTIFQPAVGAYKPRQQLSALSELRIIANSHRPTRRNSTVVWTCSDSRRLSPIHYTPPDAKQLDHRVKLRGVGRCELANIRRCATSKLRQTSHKQTDRRTRQHTVRTGGTAGDRISDVINAVDMT